ncbi:ATP-dependent rRNA helicase spb4 [Peltigera leucophlebia]|nr:ATP-dependent rRNA helicase spb4 [Peltigera leucophlebia]
MDQILRVSLRNLVKIVVKVKSLSGVEDRKTPFSLQMSYSITPASYKTSCPYQAAVVSAPIRNKSVIYICSWAAVGHLQYGLLENFRLSIIKGDWAPD